MKFTKMQGIGNDYVYINCFEEMVPDPADLAIRISDRHFGVGSDGLILICPSEIADCKMLMYNADGSQSAMCGNGLRCVGKYVYDRGICPKTTLTVEMLDGVRTLELYVENGQVQRVRVDMGAPKLRPEEIPVLAVGDSFIQQPVEVGGTTYTVTCVSVGNPHAVVFLDSLEGLDIQRIGPKFENHSLFPQRINTEFVEVVGPDTLKMRVWERGSGETMACGSGATATLVAAALTGRTSRKAKVILLGGELEIQWAEDGHVYMTGGAETVFDGEYFGA